MARPLRIERPGARYHVTARGNERKAIYRKEGDYRRFLELLGETVARFGIRVHAYTLMPNHFHILVETPEANLSRAFQWLNVSYSVWFNRCHHRDGHLFQGRFRAVIIEDNAGWREVARYVHLNPVRIAGLGLDKPRGAAVRVGMGPVSRAGLVAQRLQLLRQFPWSSYRAYAGYCAAPDWLCLQPLGRLCGGQTQAERRAAVRQYTETPARQGVIESPWERLIAGLILGTEVFAQELRRELRGNLREHTALRQLKGGVSWEAILCALEKARGEDWEQFGPRHGDWGRDAALWLARRHSRYTFGQLGKMAGRISYGTAAQAVIRFGKRLEHDRVLRLTLAKIEKELSNL
jgi:putative transposase